MSVYNRHGVTVHQGDCLDVLRAAPDDHFDSMVTDPPAGIRFMGRAWDSDMGGRHSWVAWMSERMTEAFRVLKPGAYGLVWAIPRTSHWTAWALEDAGFEIRDCVTHLFGSGFPKSLDVSKAIDKARDDNPEWRAIGAWLGERRKQAGLSHAQVCAHGGWHGATNHGGASVNWEKGHNLPTWEQWLQLRELIGFGTEMDAEVWRLNGRKGTPGNERADRVVGVDGTNVVFSPTRRVIDSGSPVLDAARQWAGWGTALKPSHEMWWLVRKPTGHADTLAAIGSELDRLESECRSAASAAERSSTPTPHDAPEARTGSAPANAATTLEDAKDRPTGTGRADGSFGPTDMSASASTAETCLSIVTSWRRCWVALCDLTNTSTTATRSNTIIDLTTLRSCLARITHESITQALSSTDGSPSIAAVADSLFAASVLTSRATRTLSVVESATAAADSKATSADGSPRDGRDQGAASPRSAAEHWWLVRKPLAGTVAANVIEHGTGALNVDATRVRPTHPEHGAPASGPLAARGSSHDNDAGSHGPVPDSVRCTCAEPPACSSDGTSPDRGSEPPRRSLSTDAPAPADVQRGLRTDLPASAQSRGPMHPSPPGSPDDCPTSPRSRDARARSAGASDRAASPLQLGAHECPDPRATSGRSPFSSRSTACPQHTAQHVDPSAGRWPTNVVLSHGGCSEDECQPGCPVAELDAQSGTLTSGKAGKNGHVRNKPDSDEGIYGGGKGLWQDAGPAGQLFSDSGGASRYFPVFKYEAKAPTVERPKLNGKAHPTVKSVGLMRWMVRLVTQPGGLVVDPFAGTGSTGHAARAEGMRAVLIEQDPDHIPLIVSRLDGYRMPAQRDAVTGEAEPLDLLDLLSDGEAS